MQMDSVELVLIKKGRGSKDSPEFLVWVAL